MTETNWAENIELEAGRVRILNQLAVVEKELSRTNRASSKRAELKEMKEALLINLREQKLRIKQSNSGRVAASHREHPVTDHALVRWLQRKHGIDVSLLKGRMLSEGLKLALLTNRSYWTDGEIVFVIGDGVVKTVIEVNNLRNGIYDEHSKTA